MKQRLSAQLNDISATVLTLLSRSGLSVESFNYRTVYHPDIYGTDGKDNAIAFSRPMQADRQDLNQA